MINLIGGELGNNNSLLGNLLIFGEVSDEMLFITLGKLASNRFTLLTISTMMSILGLIMFLPFSITEETTNPKADTKRHGLAARYNKRPTKIDYVLQIEKLWEKSMR